MIVASCYFFEGRMKRFTPITTELIEGWVANKTFTKEKPSVRLCAREVNDDAVMILYHSVEDKFELYDTLSGKCRSVFFDPSELELCVCGFNEYVEVIRGLHDDM